MAGYVSLKSFQIQGTASEGIMATLFQTISALPQSISCSIERSSLGFPESLTDAYRPRTLADFVGLVKHKAILSKLAANPKPCALLFTGGPGTGKTSMAFAFARAIMAEVHHVRPKSAS